MKAQRNSNLFGTYLKKGGGSGVVGRETDQRDHDILQAVDLLGDVVVRVLKQSGPMSMMQLFNATPGDSITQLLLAVDHLESRGVLDCVRDDNDRPVSVSLAN